MSRGNQRVLSIQSHVTFGYVGGKAAAFPLQLLGYDVDVINTVNYSNHAGYRRSGGTITSPKELAEMFEVMKQNEMLFARRLLTGFIPDKDSLEAVFKFVEENKQRNPYLLYVLDPVLGDAGRMYVDESTLPVYRSMLPLATVITPNWYEAERLADKTITDISSLRDVIKTLHETYLVKNVVISSIPLRDWLLDVLPEPLRPAPSDEDHLLCISSSSTMHMTSPSVVHARTVHLIPGYYSGVGDLFSALLLGHYHADSTANLSDTETPLSHATSQALTKTHAILHRTYLFSQSLPESERQPTDDERDDADLLRRTRRMRGRELRLVQSQDILRSSNFGNERRLEPWVGFW